MKKRMMIPVGLLLIGMLALAGNANALPYLSNYGRHESGSSQMTEKQNDGMRMKLKRTHVRGTVERVTEQAAYIRTRPNESVVVELGPRSYWEEHHFQLTPGQRVSVSGWYDPYQNSDLIFASKISGPGFNYTLVKHSGEPMWATNYVKTRGWAPTYDVYEVWYRPTYTYEPAAGSPARVEKARSEHYASKSSMTHRRHAKHASAKSSTKTQSAKQGSM